MKKNKQKSICEGINNRYTDELEQEQFMDTEHPRDKHGRFISKDVNKGISNNDE